MLVFALAVFVNLPHGDAFLDVAFNWCFGAHEFDAFEDGDGHTLGVSFAVCVVVMMRLVHRVVRGFVCVILDERIWTLAAHMRVDAKVEYHAYGVGVAAPR